MINVVWSCKGTSGCSAVVEGVHDLPLGVGEWRKLLHDKVDGSGSLIVDVSDKVVITDDSGASITVTGEYASRIDIVHSIVMTLVV